MTRRFLLIALLALFACTAVFADDEAATSSDVLDLDNDSIDDAIKNNEHILIEYFAPWCGHCKNLAPEYEKAATALIEDKIKLAKVDCIANPTVCERFEVKGYPTLIFFKEGKPREFNGPRTADGIADWLRARSGPRVSILEDEEAVKKFQTEKAGSTYLLGHFAEDSDAAKTFQAATDSADAEEWVFAHSKAGSKKNVAVLHRPFNTEDVEFSLGDSVEDLINWASEYAHPYVGEVSSQYARMTKRNKPMGLVFVDDEDKSKVDEILEWFEGVAKKLFSQMSFAHVGKQFHARLPQMGGSGEKIPTLVVLDQNGKKWPFDETQDFTVENVEKFVSGVLGGSIDPFFKSEPIPETNDEAVKVVVGKSFNSIVMDETKDVLVEFYAPWCGHCKKLVPVWTQLGEHYQGSEDVVIAKIDSASNDNPAVAIQGFPTIYLFPAGQKESPIQYNDARTLEDLIAFVEQHRTNKAASKEEAATGSHDEL